MRSLLALSAALLFACSHAKESTSADAQPAGPARAQTEAADAGAAQAAAAQAPPARAIQPAQAASGGPETAAEAAQLAAAGDAGASSGAGAAAASRAAPAGAAASTGATAASSDELACQTDDDCAFTRIGPADTDCCPMLCTPRVVAKKRAAALEARIATCRPGTNQCPVPSCMPPRQRTAPSCQAGKCVAKRLGSTRDDR